MKIALLCSGLGNINRGHEIFARDLFTLLNDEIDITLFKGGGIVQRNEVVVEHVSRNTPYLDQMHLAVAPKWQAAASEEERMRIEGETFAYAALKPLLEGDFDILHCLEQEVCNILYAKRHLFRRSPKILWSNGGALPRATQPNCDFIQEHTKYNLDKSNPSKAFLIPHGVDTTLFNPSVKSDFRAQHGIPAEAFVVISVGTICYWHKRMDYLIREISALPDVWLVIVGQESPDSGQIRSLGKELMGNRIRFMTMPHDELPKAYAAADVFALGSLFETFGIVYIEAMAMGLPVISTNHPNQIDIIKDGLFIDMKQAGALAQALRAENRSKLLDIGKNGPGIVQENYDLQTLKWKYIEHYRRMASAKIELTKYSTWKMVKDNLRNAARKGLVFNAK